MRKTGNCQQVASADNLNCQHKAAGDQLPVAIGFKKFYTISIDRNIEMVGNI